MPGYEDGEVFGGMHNELAMYGGSSDTADETELRCRAACCLTDLGVKPPCFTPRATVYIGIGGDH